MLTWLTRLVAIGSLPLVDSGLTAVEARRLGLVVQGDQVLLPADLELLDAARIQQALPDRTRQWIRSLECFSTIGSTNAVLLERAVTASIGGCVVAAELQTAGRGRRGRNWSSPFGQNIALSLGFEFPGSASGLAGFSLVVGLAVVDALEGLGVGGVSLKWPNDLLMENAKLGGILVELRGSGSAIQVVVGIGINYRLTPETRAEIGQAAFELGLLPVPPSRNALVAALIHHVRVFAEQFQETGFAPFRPTFDQQHALQGRRVRVLTGSESLQGVVAGVDDDGSLIVDSERGRQLFSGGEVSLRSA